MTRISLLACAAVAWALPLTSAIAADAFHCPPAGTMVTTDTGRVFNWMGSVPDNDAICLAREGKNPPRFWTYALVPSDDRLSADVDLTGLRRFFPLRPGEPINLNYRRTFEGSNRPFRVVGVVQQGTPMTVGGLTRQVLVINANSPNAGPGLRGGNNATFRGRFVIDQPTNALLAVDLTDLGRRVGPPTVHWRATSLQLP